MVEFSSAKVATQASKSVKNQAKGLGTKKVLSASHMSSKELNIKNCGDRGSLEWLRSRVKEATSRTLDSDPPEDGKAFSRLDAGKYQSLPSCPSVNTDIVCRKCSS